MSALTILDLSEARRAVVPTAHSRRRGDPTAAIEAASPILYGQGIGAEAGWRPYSGRLSTRDLTPTTQTRMQQIAYYLWVTNPLAQRLVELVTDFVAGEGISLKAEDEQVQAVLDEYWADPVNARDENLPREISELSIFGEQLCVLAANPVSGAVRLGYVDPQWIESVEYASLEALPGRAMAMPIAVTLTRVAGERDQKRLAIIHRDEDPYSPTYGQLIGEAMYFAVNRARAASRGISDLFASADMIDAHESTLWALVNRADMAGRFIYDVKLTGMTKEQIAEWLKINGKPPAPGAIRAHNEGVEWTLPSYQVGAGDSGETARGVRVHVLGSRGVPEHWYGSGADANLATATAQGEPIIKMLGRRARYVKAMEQAKGEYVLARKIAAGVLPESVNRKFAVVMPELSVRDLVKASSALAQIAAAVAGLQGAEVMDKRTAARAVAAVLPQIGVDGVDPDEMMAAAAAEAEANKAADYMRQPPGASSQLSAISSQPNVDGRTPMREEFDPDQPRDEQGEWTSGGGSAGLRTTAGPGGRTAIRVADPALPISRTAKLKAKLEPQITAWTEGKHREIAAEAEAALVSGKPERSPILMGIRIQNGTGPAYRGLQLKPDDPLMQARAGQTLELMPQSFSHEEKVAHSFALDEKAGHLPVILHVTGAEKGRIHGVHVGAHGVYSDEAEIITGGRFRVSGVEIKGRIRFVTLVQTGVF